LPWARRLRRTDFSADRVCQLPKRSKDGGPARRLLAIAAVFDGASREDAAGLVAYISVSDDAINRALASECAAEGLYKARMSVGRRDGSSSFNQSEDQTVMTSIVGSRLKFWRAGAQISVLGTERLDADPFAGPVR
jgi:hypothetical protein